MKKIFLACCFAVLGDVPGYSQAEILTQASKLYDANYNMDFETIADLTYPEAIAQSGGKEQFIQKLDKEYQNEEYRRRLQLTAPVFQVNPVKTIGSRKFCVISFRNPTRYFYESKLSSDEIQKKVLTWKQLTGTKEVFAEPNRNSINVKRVSRYVGVQDASTNGQWKFFDFDDVKQAEAFHSIFASEKTQLGL